MVAAATLLSCAMTTTTTTTTLISATNNNNNNNNNNNKDEWQQKEQELNYKKNSTTTTVNLNSTTTTTIQNKLTKMKTNSDLNAQQNNNSTEIEEIDGKEILDCYEGEISNTSAEWEKFRWSPESTRLMLKLRFERNIEFTQRHRQKKDLWSEIAQLMRIEGNFHTTGEICDLKYRNMLQTYKKNYIKEERGMQSQIVWEYYELFKEATKACAALVGDELVPSQLCESICDNNNEQLLNIIKKEQTSDDNDCNEVPLPTTDNETTQEKDGISNDEDNVQLKEPTTSLPKRRAPSARVLAYNNKRARLNSVSSHIEAGSNNNSEFDVTQQLPNLEPKTTEYVPAGCLNTTRSTLTPPQPQPYTSLQSYPQPPPWLTDSELREYFVYGESVGLQIAHIRDPRTRAFLQLKIQETLFLAKVGKLTD